MPTLVIANKLYSSWSMRPWLLMKQLGIAFDEIVIPLDQPDTPARIRKHSPAGKVPILIDGDVTVWESIAIMEYVADTYSTSVWPLDPKARAMARAISAEMHAGFQALRSACPMNLGKKYPERDRGEAVARDVARIEQIFREARRRFVARADEMLGGLDGRQIAVWGLSFKEGTDDLRDSPAVEVVKLLVERGASVRAHDPAALANAAQRLPGIVLCEDPYEAAAGADAVALCTPWPEYAAIDFGRLSRVMRGDLFLDGRNMLDAAKVEAAGLRYVGIGRGMRQTPAKTAVQAFPLRSS